MRYHLSENDQPRAASQYIKDLCLIVEAYTGEDVLALEKEYFEDGELIRGTLTIHPLREE